MAHQHKIGNFVPLRQRDHTSVVRPMAHDTSSPPKLLVLETGTSNFARVPSILVPDFSDTRNLGPV